MKTTIPTDWSEVKLSKYQQFYRETRGDEARLLKAALNVFAGVDYRTQQQATRKSLDRVITAVNELFDKQDFQFAQRFKLNGVEFGFVPNLDEISAGEYADIDDNLHNWETIHRAMAVLYRPIVRTISSYYDVEPYAGTSKYAEQMKGAPMSVVFGAQLFFWTLGNDLLAAIPEYLKLELTNTVKKRNLPKNGGGLGLLSVSLKSLQQPFRPLPNGPLG